MASNFTIGIEEEYFIVDARTNEVANRTPDALFRDASRLAGGCVTREFLQTQVEVVTRPHKTIAGVREELCGLRIGLAEAAARYGLSIVAAGTHPTGRWAKSQCVPSERYRAIMDNLQMVGRRNMLCGTHVHVELPDPDRRVDVMSRLLPYVPLLLALSTSSPFWQGRSTGLKGYRLAAYDELPRTGLPEWFRTTAEYDAYVAALVGSGIMPDASHIWWAVRPSVAFPTLELRALDCCTYLDDTIAIAALYRSLLRHLYYNRSRNGGLTAVDRAIAVENQWRAKRFGIDAELATRTGAIRVDRMLDEVLGMIMEDAIALGCVKQVLDCRTIVEVGTSADHQLRIFEDHVEDLGAERALANVLNWIGERTLAATAMRQTA